MSPYWRFSQKFEKLSHVLDRRATDRNQQLLDASLIYTSDLFDANWYLENYKDVAAVDVDPVQHYLSYGAFEEETLHHVLMVTGTFKDILMWRKRA